MIPLVGVRVGQRHEPSGVCVVEESTRDETHYLVRHLERIPAGSTLPEITERTQQIVHGASWKRMEYSAVYLDLTGRGTPVLEYMQKAIFLGLFVPVYFNYGDQLREEYPNVHLGKAYLVTRLQLLLQTGRLHLPDTREARLLAEELQEYQIQIHPQANDTYGAFTLGTRDELVTALGMAVSGAMRHTSATLRAW